MDRAQMQGSEWAVLLKELGDHICNAFNRPKQTYGLTAMNHYSPKDPSLKEEFI